VKAATGFSGAVILWAAAALNAQPPAPAPGPPPIPTPLTLQDAEAIAVRNNPQVSGALLNAAAANQVTIEVRSAQLPTLNGSVTGVGALNGTALTAGALTNSTVYDRLAAGVSVSQLITDFGRQSNLTASARLHAEARADSARAARADIILQADRAFFSALRATSVLTVAEETVKERQLVVDQIGALTNAQLKSGLDLSIAQVNLSEARLLLLSAQNDVDGAWAELSNALGYREPHTFTLSDAGLPAAPPTDVNPLIQQSLVQRPEVQSARTDLEGARKFSQAEKDLRNPTISALAATGVTPARQSNLDSRYGAAGVNVNIPIFNGHLFSARASEAELHAQEAEQLVRAVENRVSRDVQLAFLNASVAWQRLGVTQELLNQATQSVDLAQSRYNLGLSSIVELSQTQLNLTSAQIANAQAKFDYALQRAVLDYQAGVTR
jgi:outer membrane protein